MVSRTGQLGLFDHPPGEVQRVDGVVLRGLGAMRGRGVRGPRAGAAVPGVIMR
jgi:hypothetical protein